MAYGVLQPGDDLPDGVPFVRVGDIDDGRIDLGGLKRISKSIADRYPLTHLQGGEVLITLVGAIGRTAVAPPGLSGANTARAVGVIPVDDELESNWIEIWFRNPAMVARMTSLAHEVARKTLNLEDVRRAHVAIPPKVEQAIDVAETDALLTSINHLEDSLEGFDQLNGSLRQSILHQAFTGQSVPQDPEDEPASVLLERIKANRQRQGNGKAKRGRKTTNQIELGV